MSDIGSENHIQDREPQDFADLKRMAGELEQLRRQMDQLIETLSKYRELADAVQSARVMDLSIYGAQPGLTGAQWLSIDHDDYMKIMELLSALDLWKPWNRVIQRRF